jgi:predicted lipid-binding transport protein (Tim44 family)
LKWSITLMIAGALIVVLGFVPPYLGGITINTLEGTASFCAIGILIFLIGLLIRKAKRAFKTSFQNTST